MVGPTQNKSVKSFTNMLTPGSLSVFFLKLLSTQWVYHIRFDFFRMTYLLKFDVKHSSVRQVEDLQLTIEQFKYMCKHSLLQTPI